MDLIQEYKEKLKRARLDVCPNRIPGAARKKYVILNQKPKEKWSEEETTFMEYASYIREARDRYFQEHGFEVQGKASKQVEDISMIQSVTEEELKNEGILLTGAGT